MERYNWTIEIGRESADHRRIIFMVDGIMDATESEAEAFARRMLARGRKSDPQAVAYLMRERIIT